MRRSRNVRIILFIWICILLYGTMTFIILFLQDRKRNRGGWEELPARERITVEDGSPYGQSLDYTLSGYTYFTYEEGELTGRFIYDVDESNIGELAGWTVWKQDADGNIVREYTQNGYAGSGGIPSERIYKYDGDMRLLHQTEYGKNGLKGERFYRYLEDYYVCVRYDYSDQVAGDGGDVRSAVSYSSFVYDNDENEICCYYYDEDGNPEYVIYREFDENGRQIMERAGENDRELTGLWTMEWEELPGNTRLLNGVCRYREEDTESLYSRYHAELDEDELLWELFLVEDSLRYVRAFDYDADGNAVAETEYALYDGRGHNRFRRMQYNEDGQILEIYEYEVTGTVRQACKDEGCVEFMIAGASEVPEKIIRWDKREKQAEYFDFKEDGSLAGCQSPGF